MNNPKRGEIYRYERTYTDKLTGKKEYESVPCIIISPNRRNDISTSIMVATVSTTVGALRYPDEQFNITDGQLKNHVVSCGSLFTMDRSRLQVRVGALSDADMDKLDECLLNSVGIEAVLVDEEYEAEEKEFREKTESVKHEKESEGLPVAGMTAVTIHTNQLKMERDFYREQYEMLLDRLMQK